MSETNTRKTVIEKFNHMSGKNCQLSSLRKVLAYYDINLSEEMLLGLSSGLGFIYWDSKQMPCPFAGGLNAKEYSMFENALKILGGDIGRIKQTTSRKTSYNLLLEALEGGDPVITFVDMAYLPYFFSENAPYPNENAGHFGGHTFVVYGVDEDINEVFVSDRFAKPNTMKIEHFLDGHGSSYAPFPAKNKKLILHPPKEINNLEEMIVRAIKENSISILNPPISNFGLKGIKKFSDMVIRNWSKYDSEKLLLTLFNSFIYNATGGSGGALFRNMYTDFLKESFQITGIRELDKTSQLYQEAAMKWDEVSITLLPDELSSLKKLRDLMIENNRIQEEAGENYQKELNKLDDQMLQALEDAKKEVKNYGPFFGKLQSKIKEAYELETKAWKILEQIK